MAKTSLKELLETLQKDRNSFSNIANRLSSSSSSMGSHPIMMPAILAEQQTRANTKERLANMGDTQFKFAGQLAAQGAMANQLLANAFTKPPKAPTEPRPPISYIPTLDEDDPYWQPKTGAKEHRDRIEEAIGTPPTDTSTQSTTEEAKTGDDRQAFHTPNNNNNNNKGIPVSYNRPLSASEDEWRKKFALTNALTGAPTTIGTHKLVDGRYEVPIKDLGNQLQKTGYFKVTEHPEFGGVTPGVHVKNSHHDYGEAIDWFLRRSQGDFGPDGETRWDDYQANLGRFLDDISSPKGGNVFYKGKIPGHETHIDSSSRGGKFYLTPRQYEYLRWTPKSTIKNYGNSTIY